MGWVSRWVGQSSVRISDCINRSIPALLAAIWLLGLAGPLDARAGIYRYIDDQGVLHFADSPRDARYKRVKRVHQDGPVISPKPHVRVPRERDYDRLIVKIATRHRVEPALVKAVIATESNFKPDAVSRVGAQGLMQLMPATAASLGVERPFGVVENMDGGVRYLRLMLDRYGDLTRALAAYNAGPSAVDRYKGVPPYRETQAYVKRVLEYYRGYRREFERPVPGDTKVVAR
jgi:soluble lytic murein transglycosylase-like protein